MGKHWRTERDSDGILWLHFNQQESPLNPLSPETLEELDRRLSAAAAVDPVALVILSDKPAGFIAGADVKGFLGLSDPQQVAQAIRKTHALFHKLEQLPFPTVAMIHGYCLGGGLELALACRYRIASDDPSTRLGFPEVRLGIFPGFGGSVRSTRLLGPIRAMKLMLTGRSLSSRSAQKIGLLDLSVPERQLQDAARRVIHHPPPGTSPSPGMPACLEICFCGRCSPVF